MTADINDVKLYQINNVGSTPWAPIGGPLFTFKYGSVDLNYSRDIVDLPIPGQLLPLYQWDSKTQTRTITVKGTMVSGGSYSAGNGQGTLIQQMFDLVGNLYTATTDANENLSAITNVATDATRGINRAGLYALQVPLPDGTYYWALGSINSLDFSISAGAPAAMTVTLTFEESANAIGLGGT